MTCALLRISAGLLLAGGATAALACGYCIEDRVAAAYDHAVVSRALSARHHVAFCVIDGGLVPSDALRREIERTVESTRGVDRSSVKVSLETASLSFAYDPARAPLGPLLRGVNRKLAPKGLSLMPLRVIERYGELRPASSP